MLTATRSQATRTNRWHDSHDNVLSLANALVYDCYLSTCEDLLRYFEKPWNWDREWEWFAEHRTMDGFEGKS